MDKAGKKDHKGALMSQSDISKVFDEYTKTFESLLALAEEQEKSGAIDTEYQDLYMRVFEGYIEFSREVQGIESDRVSEILSKQRPIKRQLSESPLPMLEDMLRHSRSVSADLGPQIPEELEEEEYFPIKRFESENMRDRVSTSFLPVESEPLAELASKSMGNKYSGGNTILHNAARSFKSAGVLARLVEMNADLAETNDEGDSPLHVSVRVGHLEAVKLFSSLGLSAKQSNNAGDTPLSLAEGNKEVTDILETESESPLPPTPAGSAEQGQDTDESSNQNKLHLGVVNETYVLVSEDVEILDLDLGYISYKHNITSEACDESEESLCEIEQDKENNAKIQFDEPLNYGFKSHSDDLEVSGVLDVVGSHILS